MKIRAIHISRIVALLLAIALIVPIVLYVATFGTSLSHDHTRWSDMGGFIGGIYAPIAALLTLTIIAGQLSSQIQFNKHQIDHSFLNNSRADLHFYIDQLEKVLQKHEQISNVPLSHTINTMFGSRTHEELKGPIYNKDVRRVGMTDSRVSGIWGAIYAIFSGLKASNETDYNLVYVSSKQKCISIFGYALCDALDNFHFVSCQYPSDFPYEFYHPPKAEI
jgi:hypothetical protein